MTFSPKAIEAAVNAIGKLRKARRAAIQFAPYGTSMRITDKDLAETALTAALAVDGVVLQGWQDISTAPKDGTPILWSCGDDKMSVIHSPEYDLCFEGGYWMPLPQPPAASDREERR